MKCLHAPTPARLALAALLLWACTLCGCNIGGWVANVVGGGDETKDVQALYNGLKNKKTAVLVFMDDNALLNFPDADKQLCQAVCQQITLQIPGATVVTPAQIALFRQNKPNLAAVPYGDTLAALKVDRLLWVDVADYHTHDPGNAHQWQGVVSAHISVYAAESKTPDDAVYANDVRVEYPKDAETGMLNSDSATIEEATRLAFAMQTAWLFSDHKEPVDK